MTVCFFFLKGGGRGASYTAAYVPVLADYSSFMAAFLGEDSSFANSILQRLRFVCVCVCVCVLHAHVVVHMQQASCTHVF